MTDHPYTQAKPVPAVVVIAPTTWTELGPDYADIRIQRITVQIVDFYPRSQHDN